MGAEGIECSFGSILPGVYLIDYGIAAPLRMLHRCVSRSLAEAGEPCEQRDERREYFLHHFLVGSRLMGISRAIEWSSEMRVSVPVTPGIIWIFLLRSSIRCSLSRA